MQSVVVVGWYLRVDSPSNDDESFVEHRGASEGRQAFSRVFLELLYDSGAPLVFLVRRGETRTILLGQSCIRSGDPLAKLSSHLVNPFVFTTLLKLLVSMDLADVCWSVHAYVYKLGHNSDANIGITLIDAYSVSGNVDAAHQVFNGIYSFLPDEDSRVYNENFTVSATLKSCLGLEVFKVGKSVHGWALKTCYDRDLYVGTSLLEFYSKSGEIFDAQRFFEEMPKDDLVPWNFGKKIHSSVLKVGLDSNMFVSNALMDVYAKCGEIENSMKLFQESADKSKVTWSTIIVGYVQLGDMEEAMNLFSNMLGYNIKPTEVMYSSVFRACDSLVTIELGRQIHSLTITTMYNKGITVANSLIDMYAKCGKIEKARLAFDTVDERDEVSWNDVVCGYSMHGLAIQDC
ncbi:hypothetical protein VNO77_38987 [Canavalia gladiata]|uniref:Pentatricopeptide repeat-containing protein n=1 Tax=Canavalia gladiata TaxID=3824 RepID=A0AAN9KBU9_CANGL